MSKKYTLMNTKKAQFPHHLDGYLLNVSTSGYYAWVCTRRRRDDQMPPRVMSRRGLDRRMQGIWADSHRMSIPGFTPSWPVRAW